MFRTILRGVFQCSFRSACQPCISCVSTGDRSNPEASSSPFPRGADTPRVFAYHGRSQRSRQVPLRRIIQTLPGLSGIGPRTVPPDILRGGNMLTGILRNRLLCSGHAGIKDGMISIEEQVLRAVIFCWLKQNRIPEENNARCFLSKTWKRQD